VQLSSIEARKQRVKWVSKEVLAVYREQGLCVYCGLPSHSLPSCNYLPPPKELRLSITGQNSPISIARSTTSKKLSIAQVRIERIRQLNDELNKLEEEEDAERYRKSSYRKLDYRAGQRHP
jgi:hypothetical protein